MCLYPRKIINKKYIPNEKNRGIVPDLPVIGSRKIVTDYIINDNYHVEKNIESEIPIYDERVLHVEVPCGQCEECRKQKAHDWQIRLTEELKNWKYAYFITLTFSPEALRDIKFKHKIDECNAACGYAVRHMLERYRKDHKVSLKHWLVTELGHEGTERIHMHGLLFNNDPLEFTPTDDKNFYKWKYWKYGNIFVGTYCTNRTINYIVKYITKIDNDHKGFIGQILASPGIGRSYIDNLYKNRINYGYRPRNSATYYFLDNGSKLKLPTYYKNKIYNEEEREKIWRDFMDREQITIAGNNYNLKNTTEKQIQNISNKAKEINKQVGYGSDSKEWRKKPYNLTRKMLQDQERKKQKDIMMEAILRKNEKNSQKNLEI